VQIINQIDSYRRYFQEPQHGPARKYIYLKNKPNKIARNHGNLTKRSAELRKRAIHPKKKSQCHSFFRRM